MVGAAMELWARLGIGERAEESGSERRKRMLCSRAPSQELPITSDALAERCFGNFPYRLPWYEGTKILPKLRCGAQPFSALRHVVPLLHSVAYSVVGIRRYNRTLRLRNDRPGGR